MTNSEWVTLHISWKAVSSYLFLWPTASEWHCTFEIQAVSSDPHCHHLFSYDQQWVSVIACFVQGNLMTSFPMTNSLWVILHILHQPVSLCLFPWPTACEWHCKSFWPAFSTCFNSWYIITSYVYTYIRKWACCYISSMCSFYIIVIIDCNVSFQLTHSHLMWSFLHPYHFPGDPGEWWWFMRY